MAKLHATTALLLLCVLASPAAAIDVVIDYSYDTSNFFGAGNPDGETAGLNARASLEAAAGYFSDILDDTFSEVRTPDPYQSQSFPSTYIWQWTARFTDPTEGTLEILYDPTFAENEYRIYAGARTLPTGTLGVGGAGAYSINFYGTGPGFTAQENAEISAISEAFLADIERRDEPVGEFGAWGGVITFASNRSDWHYDHLTEPGFYDFDFYSTAIHELAHALGFGGAEWMDLVANLQFQGDAARAVNGGVYPQVDPGNTGQGTGHWLTGVSSTVFGSSVAQETAMDPNISNGQRKHFTTLDAAAMTDIGWQVLEPAPTLTGDYNFDNAVDALDFAIWRESVATGSVIGSFSGWLNNYGASLPTSPPPTTPEPAAALLAGVAAFFGVVGRRRR